jgi:TetR/AcrR family transcriptional repressor of bet genes
MRGRPPENVRERLLAGTIRAVHRYGFSNTTVAKVAAIAGVSTGNIHHRFGDKEGLLEAAMRFLLEMLREETVLRLSRARTPRERLSAIIEANFSPRLYCAEICRAWAQFWAHAPSSSRLARLERVSARRVRSHLAGPLRQLIGARRAVEVTNILVALIDGFWIHLAQQDFALGPAEARRILERQLDLALADAVAAQEQPDNPLDCRAN